MKKFTSILPILTVAIAAVVARRYNQRPIGHPADYYTVDDLENYRTYLEAGYGPDYTEAELLPNERHRLHTLEEAAEEHGRRLFAQQQHIHDLRRERDNAQARANLEDYEKYLNRKYGPGWHPGLIDEWDRDTWNMLYNNANMA